MKAHQSFNKFHLFGLFIIFACANADAGEGSLADRGLLFDANSSDKDRQISGWHQSMGAAVADARPLTLNISVLYEIKGASKRESRNREVMVGQSMDVILPDQSQPMTLDVAKVEEIVDGVVTYSGSVAGVSGAFFTLSLSVESRRLLGSILLGEVVFIIRPTGATTKGHELVVVDRGMLPRDDDSIPPKAGALSDGETTTFSTASTTTGSGDVRTMFLYANNVGNQSAMTSHIISEFNNALLRSGVASANKLSNAGIRTVASGFTGDNGATIRSGV